MLKKIINIWFFTEVTSFLKRGVKRSICEIDLLNLPPNTASENNTKKFWDIWHANGGTTRQILDKLFRNEIRFISIVAAIHLIFAVVTPIFLNRLLFALGNQEVFPQSELIFLVLGLFVSTLMFGLCNEQIFHFPRILALKVHGTIIGSIGYKVSIDNLKMNHGQIVNFVASDSWRIFELYVQKHRLWAIPIQILLLLILLLVFLGPAGLLGIAIMLAISPLSAKVIARLGLNRSLLLKISDQRMNLLASGIKGIRSLKLSFSEKLLIKKIMELRDQELVALRKRVLLTTLSSLIVLGSGTIVAACSIILHGFLGNELTAASVFSTIALFGLLQTPVGQLSNGFRVFTESSKSLHRLDKFFFSKSITPIKHNLEQSTQSIHLESAVFKGSEVQQNFSAHFNLIKSGLITIEGKAGVGKSLFLSALMGEVHLSDGKGTINGNLASVRQNEWLMTDTIKTTSFLGGFWTKITINPLSKLFV